MPATLERDQGSLTFPRTETLGLDQIRELFEHFITEAREHDNFLYEVAAWHLAIRGLQMLEDYLTIPPTPEALEGHRAFLDAILMQGRLIHERIRREPNAENMFGCDGRQVSANVEWLENKRAMWHQQMHPEREREILSIFGEHTPQ